MKRFLMVTACFLLALLNVNPHTVSADVIWEPTKNFFEEHNVAASYENRNYIVNSRDGFINIYESPDSLITVGTLKNGEVFRVYYSGSYNGKLWGMNTNEQFIILDECILQYDSISFMEDHKAELITGDETSYPIEKGMAIWTYPGKYSGNDLNFNFFSGNEECRLSYVDENGLKWAHVSYLYGLRDFWICLDDPFNPEALKSEVTYSLYEAVEPTSREIREKASEDIATGRIGSRKGIFIVIIVLCSFAIVYCAAFVVSRKLNR